MEEIWRDVTDYPGYQVSNRGQVRSFWQMRKRFGSWGGTERVLTDVPYILPASDDGNGYLKVFMTDKNGKGHCCKIHRLVAEKFIPHTPDCDTVDHIRSGKTGKLDNSVENLRWISRHDNITKAYKDGMCDERIKAQRKPVYIFDPGADMLRIAGSVTEAAKLLGVHYTSVSHALSTNTGKVAGCHVSINGLEDVLQYRR